MEIISAMSPKCENFFPDGTTAKGGPFLHSQQKWAGLRHLTSLNSTVRVAHFALEKWATHTAMKQTACEAPHFWVSQMKWDTFGVKANFYNNKAVPFWLKIGTENRSADGRS